MTDITRRTLLQGAGAGLALAAGARRGWTATSLDIGEARITTLRDGYLTQPASFALDGMDKAVYEPILIRYGQPLDRLMPECNVTLVRHEDRVILFDAGSGPAFVPTAGFIGEALDAAGLTPEDITHVVFTHAHADHLWGVLDDFDEPYFPAAHHMIGRIELEFWLSDGALDAVGEARASFAVGARRRLELMEDAIEPFDDGQEILPGIAARMTPGHTPGHMSFELRSGSDAVMILGDAVSNHHISFERPELEYGTDQDRPLAAATRLRLLDQVAQGQMGIVGFHLPEGGIGRVERSGSGYRFVRA